MLSNRTLCFLQLPGTLLILAFVPSNAGKLVAFLLLWGITFVRLSRPEWVFVTIACVFFTAMNVASLEQGIFSFSHPDVLGQPVYELFMWGFYLLHTRRLIGGPAPGGRSIVVWMLAGLYCAAFAAVPDATALLATSGTLLIIGLVLFHEPLDIAYTVYFVVLGAAIEYTGVFAGQWHYPGDPLGGVPLWFVTLWGGVGLFLRRLVLPVLVRHEIKGEAAA